MRDRSLDEFVTVDDGPGGSDGESADDGTEEAAGDGRPTDPAVTGDDTGLAADDAAMVGDTGDVEPVVSTAEWHSVGAACAACGATVERRWHGEAGAVCADCKEW
jgi:hypothetical protein